MKIEIEVKTDATNEFFVKSYPNLSIFTFYGQLVIEKKEKAFFFIFDQKHKISL